MFRLFHFNAGDAVKLPNGAFQRDAEFGTEHFQRRFNQVGSGENSHKIQFLVQVAANSPDVFNIQLLQPGKNVGGGCQGENFADALFLARSPASLQSVLLGAMPTETEMPICLSTAWRIIKATRI